MRLHCTSIRDDWVGWSPNSVRRSDEQGALDVPAKKKTGGPPLEKIGVWTRRLTNQWDGASLVRATWISIQCPSAGRGTNQTSPSRMWRQGCPPYTCRSDIRYPVRSGNAPIVVERPGRELVTLPKRLCSIKEKLHLAKPSWLTTLVNYLVA